MGPMLLYVQCYCMSNVIVCPMLLYVFCQIFEPTFYAGLQPADAGLLRLGRQELDMLLGHFGVPKTSHDGKLHDAVICAETCRQEFLTFKRAAVHHRDACSERGRAGMWQKGASWDVTRGGELGCGERGRAGMWREGASWDVARGGELGCGERGRAGM